MSIQHLHEGTESAGRRATRSIPCMYCGNTGTVNAAPCPVCRSGGRTADV
jgi:hypothetical protein